MSECKTDDGIPIVLFADTMPEFSVEDKEQIDKLIVLVTAALEKNKFPFFISCQRVGVDPWLPDFSTRLDKFQQEHNTKASAIMHKPHVMREVHNKLKIAGYCVAYTNIYRDPVQNYRGAFEMRVRRPDRYSNNKAGDIDITNAQFYLWLWNKPPIFEKKMKKKIVLVKRCVLADI